MASPPRPPPSSNPPRSPRLSFIIGPDNVAHMPEYMVLEKTSCFSVHFGGKEAARGRLLTPSECRNAPSVTFDRLASGTGLDADAYYTLPVRIFHRQHCVVN